MTTTKTDAQTVLEALNKIIAYNNASIYGHLSPENNDHRLVTIHHAQLAKPAAQRLVDAEVLAHRLADALDNLVGLKRYKEINGKDSYYENAQPIAWQKAHAVLVGYDSFNQATPPTTSEEV